jgi:hypothetical protein
MGVERSAVQRANERDDPFARGKTLRLDLLVQFPLW